MDDMNDYEVECPFCYQKLENVELNKLLEVKCSCCKFFFSYSVKNGVPPKLEVLDEFFEKVSCYNITISFYKSGRQRIKKLQKEMHNG